MQTDYTNEHTSNLLSHSNLTKGVQKLFLSQRKLFTINAEEENFQCSLLYIKFEIISTMKPPKQETIKEKE